MKNFYVYILTNKSGTLYTGMTNDLVRRLSEHRQKLVPGFTERYNITKLIYYERHTMAKDAIAREKTIKGWVRRRKIGLIEEQNPKWLDLSDEWDEFKK